MGARGPQAKEPRGRPAKREPSSDARHPPGNPKPPQWLAKIARDEWKRIAELMASQGKLTDFDLSVLLRYTTAYADMVKFRKLIDKLKSPTVTSKRGGDRKDPLYALEAEARRELQTCAKVMGLDPYHRERLAPPATPSAAKLKILEFQEKAKARKHGG